MTTANSGVTAFGEGSLVANTIQSRREASVYVGPWYAEHRNVSHFYRLKSEGRLRECDGLAVDVAKKQDVLRRELEKLAGRNWRLAQATFSDLFFYLKTFPIHLGTLSDATKTAESEFDAARARYHRDCLGRPAPLYETQSLRAPAHDDEFSAIDLPTTIGGEEMLSEPPMGILLIGYGILGLAIIAAAAGPELAAGVEIAPFIPELVPIFSGLRFVMP